MGFLFTSPAADIISYGRRALLEKVIFLFYNTKTGYLSRKYDAGAC
jgi:hypothetical protein